MVFQQKETLFHCEIGGSIVFLDLCRDRYFMVKGPTADAFQAFHAGRARPDDIDALLKAQILDEVVGDVAIRADPAALPQRSRVEMPLPKPSFWLVIEAVLTQLWVRRQIKRRRLADIMGELEIWAQRATIPSSTVPSLIASAFVRARRYVAYEDYCLSRGIAMMRMLLRRRCRATLSLGVTLPFAAHCWAQSGGDVLTDRLDQIHPFTPIFSITAS